jgi:hypothetical protein
MAVKQTYWDTITKDIPAKELDNFSKNFNIPKDNKLKEAFYRAKNSFSEFEINLDKLEEPTKTMLFESVVYIWYREGYNEIGKNIIKKGLTAFKKHKTFYSFKSALPERKSKEDLEKILEKNENK